MANDTFFSKLPLIIKAIASGDAGIIELMDEDFVHRLARYVRQVLLLQSDDVPYTTGCKSAVRAIEEQGISPAELGEQLVAILATDGEPYAIKTDPKKGEKYVSVDPRWWVRVELEAALALAAS